MSDFEKVLKQRIFCMKKQLLKNPVWLMIFALLLTGPIAFSQVTGTVSSSDGSETLIGVNILIKGTLQGTVTDFDGNFSLEASPQDTLIFSYTGYETQEIWVGNQNLINVLMQETSTDLGEVVVIGYGSMRKSDVTGSIISVTDEALTDVRAGNVLEALQGRIA
ncbi:MAG: hypothetical protein DWQ02_24270, partial [Bacteroidetes bacterium]